MTFVFDCDSTLINCESLEELAAIALDGNPDRERIVAEIDGITNQGMIGQISFDESLERRLKLFSATREDVQKLADKLLGCLSDSVLRSTEWLSENRDRIYIISGGFRDYLVPVIEKLGLRSDHLYANEFVYENDKIVGVNPEVILSKPNGKVKQVESLELSGPIVIIGDGNTDAEVKEAGLADEFWAYTEVVDREFVNKKADRVLNNFDEVVELAVESQKNPAKI